MSPWIGGCLAIAALAVGGWAWGWRGALLAVTLIVFWLLLQFSRALRVMRLAAGRPVGHVDSAVMLHSKLRPGLLMMDVVKLTRSLGRQEPGAAEVFTWTDGSQASVRVEFDHGRCRSWQLLRPDAAAA